MLNISSKYRSGYFLIAIVLFQNCSVNESAITQNPSFEEPRGLDLEKAILTARAADNIRSFLVSHKNELLVEEYFVSYSTDSLDHMRSVTKSVMATLIGIAIDKGFIKSVDDPIANYLNILNSDKKAITIKHLLTMTSGVRWSEEVSTSEYDTWANAQSPLQYFLEKPMARPPGMMWNYNSGGIHVLSIILSKVSGMSTLAFAEKYLFGPLDITKARWSKLRDGFCNGSSGLYLRPKDMVQIGKLYCNQGLYNDTQILSPNFIRAATEIHNTPHDSFHRGSGYGYCWWLRKDRDLSEYLAQGYAGQTIVAMPQLELVIAITHDWRVHRQPAFEQQLMATTTLIKKVVESTLKKFDGHIK